MTIPRFAPHVEGVSIPFDALDFFLDAQQLQAKYPRDERSDDSGHPVYPCRDWVYETANGYTSRGYDEWVQSHLAMVFDEMIPPEKAELEFLRQEALEVTAEVHTDDYRCQSHFNAAHWLSQASTDELMELHAAGWGRDYCADCVAYFMEHRDLGVAEVLNATRPASVHDDGLGFEVTIDATSAIRWLQHNRPADWAILTCGDHGVHLHQLDGMGADQPNWTWTNGEGAQAASCFASLGAAAMNAVATMALTNAHDLEQALEAFQHEALLKAGLRAFQLPGTTPAGSDNPTLKPRGTVPAADPTDMAYLFRQFDALQVARGGLTFGGELENAGAMMEYAMLCADAIQRMIDFDQGFDGVFAYDVLDNHYEGSLPLKLYAGLVANGKKEDLIVAEHAFEQGWPLRAEATELLQAHGITREQSFDPSPSF